MGEEVEAGPSSRPGKLKISNRYFFDIYFLLLAIPSSGRDAPAPSDVGGEVEEVSDQLLVELFAQG